MPVHEGHEWGWVMEIMHLHDVVRKSALIEFFYN